MLHCYFIARSGPPIESLSFPSLGASALSFVRHQDLVAAVRLYPAGTRFTPQAMLEYNAILAAASRRSTVLPLRFGASFRDEAAVIRLLASRERELAATLDQLDGTAEMTVRVLVPAGEMAHRLADEINARARPLASRVEVHSNRAGQTVLEMSHLIPRHQAVEYRQRLAATGVEISDPRPPMHFLPEFLRLPVRAERERRRRAAAAGAG